MPKKDKLSKSDATYFLATAHALADASGPAIRPYFRRTITIENKDTGAGFDPVTEADKKAERIMRRALASRHPDHAVTGEEYADTDGTTPHRWVLDPIDGTRAFMSGFPLWGTLIGLLEFDQPVIGMMDQPVLGERFWSDGGQSYVRRADGKTAKIKSRTCKNLDQATLVTTSPDLFTTSAERSAFDRMRSAVRMTRYGGDCYGYCMLAAGHIDLVVEAGLKAVDIVALIPIIEHAGGCVTTWRGESAIHGGNIVASGNPDLHRQALQLLSLKKSK